MLVDADSLINININNKDNNDIFENNDHDTINNADLVDADSLIFVGEVAGEKIQGGGRGVDLHCALGYSMTKYFGSNIF